MILQTTSQSVTGKIRDVWNCTAPYNGWFDGNISCHTDHGNTPYNSEHLCHLLIHMQTTGQLLFAITMTMYIMIAVLCLEERDLVHYFGSKYEEYKKTTPAFIPSLWRSHKLASD